MAEFGIKATELSAPQGAGSQPVAPVQTMVVPKTLPEGLLSVASNAAITFTKAAEKNTANAVLRDYQNELAVVSQALDSGSIKPQEAQARVGAIGTRYSAMTAGNLELTEALEKTRKAVFGISTLSKAEEDVKNAREQRNTMTAFLRSKNFYVDPNASDRELQQLAYSASVIDQQTATLQRMMEARREVRAEGEFARGETRFANEITDREDKRRSIQTINMIGKTYAEQAIDIGSKLKISVDNNTMTHDEARGQINSYFAGLQAQIAIMETNNPGQAASWRTMFDQAKEAALMQVDPNADIKKTENRIKLLKNNFTLAAIAQDPQTLSVMVANEMFPGAATAVLSTNATFGRTLSNLMNFANSPQARAAISFNGTPGSEAKDAEVGIYDYTKSTLNAMANGESSPGRTAQVKNFNDGILSSLSRVANDSTVRPQDLKEVTRFMADPSFKYAIENKLVSPEALAGAKRSWQTTYEREAIATVQRRLMSPEGLPVKARAGNENAKLADMLSVSFQGNGVVFTPKVPGTRLGGGAPVMARELQGITEGLNQLIMAGAHLEGSTNYQQYWEKNKARLLPDYFASETKLQPGQVVNGYKYKGVPGLSTRDQSNWEKVEDGKQ